MKTVLLAGGTGTRISEDTSNIPKPMIQIGNKPIIWHIMNYYSKFNYKDFIICAGYKKIFIEKYFVDHKNVNVVDTGLKAQTGTRIKRIKNLIGNDENFFMTYSDGLSNIDLNELLSFHKKHGKIATLTAVKPPPKFGNLKLNNNKVIEFNEKDSHQEGWVNGGFFVLKKQVFDYINDKEDCIFEREPLQNLSKDENLMAFKHEGFWQCMDNLKEKNHLNELYNKKLHFW